MEILKRVFREFIYKEQIDFQNLSADTLVIFDTNTLLNIYRYSKDTQQKLIQSIETIKDNIWIPYQVGLEFHLNRKDTMYSMSKNKDIVISETHSKIETLKNQFHTTIFKTSSLKSYDAKDKKHEIKNYFSQTLDNLKNDIELKINELYNLVDFEIDLYEKIADLFDNKTGESYNQEELNEKLKDAADRYKDKIPPGYMDKNKGKRFYNGLEINSDYGDLIVWHQMMDKAKEGFKKIVFITDDAKEDWWYKKDGETIGPRAELKNEMLRIANADFFMYDSNKFLSMVLQEENLIVEHDLFNDYNFEFNDYEELDLLDIDSSNSKEENALSEFYLFNSNDFDVLNKINHYENVIKELEMLKEKEGIDKNLRENLDSQIFEHEIDLMLLREEYRKTRAKNRHKLLKNRKNFF